MPNYNFKNLETEEITEVSMKISELDDFKANNPHLQQVLLKPPLVAYSINAGKPDNGFREVLSKAKEAHPKGNVNTF